MPELLDMLAANFPREKIDVFKMEGKDPAPLKDQLQRFRQAKIVIGPHGAALANIMACQQDTKIVELTNDWALNYFSELSARLNLEYHLVHCLSTDSTKDANLIVDPEELKILVATLLANGFEHLQTEDYNQSGKVIYVTNKEPPHGI